MTEAHIAGPGELSIPFLVDEKPNVLLAGSAGEWSGGNVRGFLGQLALAGGVRLSDGLSEDIANAVRALDRSRP